MRYRIDFNRQKRTIAIAFLFIVTTILTILFARSPVASHFLYAEQKKFLT